MPEHSKEQILAALEALGHDGPACQPLFDASSLFCGQNMDNYEQVFNEYRAKYAAKGLPDREATFRAAMILSGVSIDLGFRAAQRLQEIDQLEAMEIT